MAKNTILEHALRGKVPQGAENIALDGLQSMLEVMLVRNMEAEVSACVAADRYERSDERNGYRNGTSIAGVFDATRGAMNHTGVPCSPSRSVAPSDLACWYVYDSAVAKSQAVCVIYSWTTLTPLHARCVTRFYGISEMPLVDHGRIHGAVPQNRLCHLVARDLAFNKAVRDRTRRCINLKIFDAKRTKRVFDVALTLLDVERRHRGLNTSATSQFEKRLIYPVGYVEERRRDRCRIQCRGEHARAQHDRVAERSQTLACGGTPSRTMTDPGGALVCFSAVPAMSYASACRVTRRHVTIIAVVTETVGARR